MRSPEGGKFDGAIVVSSKEANVDAPNSRNLADRVLDLDKDALYITVDMKSIGEHYRVGLPNQILRATIAPLMSSYVRIRGAQQCLTQLSIYGPRNLAG